MVVELLPAKKRTLPILQTAEPEMKVDEGAAGLMELWNSRYSRSGESDEEQAKAV